MDEFDPAHPYNDDNDQDDLFVNMMCQYYTGSLVQPDPAPLLMRRAALNRDREEGHRRLVNDYFAKNCVYQPSDFKRRFRLRKTVFERIANAMEARYEFFQMKYDARDKQGFTGLQKCVAAIKLMAMGESPDSIDDYMRMSEKTARKSLYLLAFRHPIDPRDKYFKRRQEGARKDVERAFGVLKSKWHIVEHAARPYELDTLRYIMYACIVMHNMVVEDKGRNIATYSPTEPRHVQFQPGTSEYLHRVVDIQDQRKHKQLREDLADYIYVGHEDEDE
ncbi:uncharacterized protein LOC111878468 [Lactuca sativa]|uniref:uncharacterized protein LOC111878468 n=1 Tax=Lactuca sativa TaxID=4236 RepID=UPI000CD872CF|nr:uncharacterized protein LOC111878468 [Lactuca sativa]